MERLSRAMGGLEGQLSGQPVPENDRMTQRYREEAATLQKLMASDQKLIGQVELLRSMVDLKSGAWLIENISLLQEGINAISETMRTRQLLFFPTV
jgi:hypothetical protein